MVLTQFQNVLSGSGIRFISKQLPSKLAPDLRPQDLPVADLYVVDGHAGEAATTALLGSVLNRRPEARLLVIAEMFTEKSSYAFLRAGAKGLLTYLEADGYLAKALSQVTAGGFWVPRTVLSGFVDHILNTASRGQLKADTATDLTSREQQVLEAVLENLSNKEIANKLHISERTVKFHVSRLLEKFGVHRRADLIVLWYQRRES